MQLPEVRFGNQPLPDWRKVDKDTSADDDELLETTPPDLVKLLGFDPLELEDEEPAPTEDAAPCHCQI